MYLYSCVYWWPPRAAAAAETAARRRSWHMHGVVAVVVLKKHAVCVIRDQRLVLLFDSILILVLISPGQPRDRYPYLNTT